MLLKIKWYIGRHPPHTHTHNTSTIISIIIILTEHKLCVKNHAADSVNNNYWESLTYNRKWAQNYRHNLCQQLKQVIVWQTWFYNIFLQQSLSNCRGHKENVAVPMQMPQSLSKPIAHNQHFLPETGNKWWFVAKKPPQQPINLGQRLWNAANSSKCRLTAKHPE